MITSSQDQFDELFFYVREFDDSGSPHFWSRRFSSIKHPQKDYLGRDFQSISILRHADGTIHSANLEVIEDLTCLEMEAIDLARLLPLASVDDLSAELPAEALLHACFPAPYVEQFVNMDVFRLISSSQGKVVSRDLWGDRFIWLDETLSPSQARSYLLKELADNPNTTLAILGTSGIFVWSEKGQSCLESALEVEKILHEYFLATKEPGLSTSAELTEEEKKIWYRLLPILRGGLSVHSPIIIAYDSSKPASDLSQDARLKDLLVGRNFSSNLDEWVGMIPWWADTFAEKEEALIDEIRQYLPSVREVQVLTSASPKTPLDPLPNTVFLPGLGIVCVGVDRTEAESRLQLVVSSLTSIQSNLETGQLTQTLSGILLPSVHWSRNAEEFAGQVVLITGAASGIGRASSYQFAKEGAHVVIVDLNQENADVVATEINQRHGANRAIAVRCDVRDENSVIDAYRQTVLTFGGVDVVVNNAGFAMSKTIEDTQLEDWNHIQSVMGTGYFLISREAFRVLRPQQMGGCLVFVCSKNSVRAGKEISAYSSVKALELHMARCLAEEGGQYGIRVNSVLPDAVLKGSSLFDPGLRKDRAAQYGIAADELEQYYIQRCTLKVPVYPEHVAEAIVFLSSERSSRTTGGALTVDGGVSAAFLR